MLRRFTFNILLLCLFAMVQIGIGTHEISHLKELSQHSQPEKNTTSEHCGQCIAHAQMLGAAPSQAFVLSFVQSQLHFSTVYVANLESALSAAYRARAPPKTSIS
jgi:hypothetical protein